MKTRHSLRNIEVLVEPPEALDSLLETRVRPSGALVSEWKQLRERFAAVGAWVQERLPGVLLVGRLYGSRTLATDGRARAAFADAMACSDLVGRAAALPTEVTLRELHAKLTRTRDRFRTSDGADVELEVARLFRDLPILATTREAPEVAALVDERIVSIHPFADANGRLARLMGDIILIRGGYPPVIAKPAESACGARAGSDHLARVTEGMRRSVSLAEGLA